MQPPSFFVALCDAWVNLGTIRGWKDHLWREDSLTPPQMPTYFFKDKKTLKTDVTRCEDFVLLWRGRYRGANLLGWVCQEDLGHWSLPQANLIPVLEQNQWWGKYFAFSIRKGICLKMSLVLASGKPDTCSSAKSEIRWSQLTIKMMKNKSSFFWLPINFLNEKASDLRDGG